MQVNRAQRRRCEMAAAKRALLILSRQKNKVHRIDRRT
jgi:hypothetical protein